MKKNKIVIAALASCFALSATLTGCSQISVNNKADMAQTIATVNIAKTDKFKQSELSVYGSAINETAIIKRNIVSYFLNVGYSYVQNGYSYADTFNMLMDALIDNAVLVQYSTLELLAHKAEGANKSAAEILEEYNAITADTEAETQAKRYEYLLDDEDMVLLAKYNLYSSLNSAIDSYEKSVIEEESSYTGTDTRTTPTNLETENDNYYPKTADGELDYYVYTGYTGYLLNQSGAYKDDALDGTTRATRVKAYNTFINNLRTNNLIDTETEADKLTNLLELDYIKSEYVNQLETRIINKYYEIYEDEKEQALIANDYEYLDYIYSELYKDQKGAYENSASSFESALSSMSSSSFLLYSPDTSDSEFELDGDYGTDNGRFGFVYNILLPFSAKQNAKLSELKSILSDDEKNDYYYVERNNLLKEIQTEDQRSAWFNGATDYSFNASEKGVEHYGASDYLFFEGNLTDSGENGRYKELLAYDGRYAYNGSVYENTDGSYTLIGNKLTIDGMLDEFSKYINYVLTGNENGGKVRFDNGYDPANGNQKYYQNVKFSLEDDEDEIDYSKFLYASGKVNLGTFKNEDLLNPSAAGDQYKAMSAVNELQFAYTTDTSVLSQYVGYSVSAYDTNYIKEFEYAAKLAISNGEGSFTVCAGDYGWHLIYVTYVFDKTEMYQPVWSRVEEEGTFENLFFEWMKTTDLSDITTMRRNKIINDYNKEDVSVVKYQNRYQDLLDLES